jgi:hypothetical protein
LAVVDGTDFKGIWVFGGAPSPSRAASRLNCPHGRRPVQRGEHDPEGGELTMLSKEDDFMNPTDVAQSALPLTADLSIWGLFWSAHLVVKIVMVGLLVASVWVWAIVVDKTLLYMRTKKAMDRFEQTFWSGQSLEELYRTQSARPGALDGGAVRRRDARVEALVRRHEPRDRRPADAHREGDGRDHRARDRAARAAVFWCSRRSARPGPSSACSAPSGAS